MDFDYTDTLVAKSSTHATLKQRVSAQVGVLSKKTFLMSKQLPVTKARVVLSWSDKPKDLDLHLKSNDFHISYRNKNGAAGKASLDRDSMRGFGPETITINRVDPNKKYDILVYKFSSSGNIDNKINVSVYANGKLDRSLQFPKLTGKCIKVGTLYNNKVTYDIKSVSKSQCR
jgi:uncharacterized protein YfaP (DUF2135 family)